MTQKTKIKRDSLVVKAEGGERMGQKTSTSLIRKLTAEFFNQVPKQDRLLLKESDIAAVGRSVFLWAQERKPGQRKVRVFNPRLQGDGWEIPHTVIQIITNDMPFLVDSVSAELAYQRLALDNLFHPVLHVRRAGKPGRLADVAGTTGKGLLSESYMHIQLEQMLPEEACRALEKSLGRTLEDVEAATGDWRAMLKKAESVLAEMEHYPAAVDKARAAESHALLQYLYRNNFTFLGYRRYDFSKSKGGILSKTAPGSALGVLKNDKGLVFGAGRNSPEVHALDATRDPIMVSKLIDKVARVHRRVPLDAVSIKIFDRQGRLTGSHLFVGLFTSSTYSCRTSEVPLVRRKVGDALARMNFSKNSHDGKAAEHILEKFPRDELFQYSADALVTTVKGILLLQERHRVALFTRNDPLGRYVSCLVYVPRDRYDTRFRLQAEKLLEAKIGGKSTNFYTTLDDSPLARALFTIMLAPGQAPSFDRAGLEHSLIEMARAWPERLKKALLDEHGKVLGNGFYHSYAEAFPVSYQETVSAESALHDIAYIDALRVGIDDVSVNLYQPKGASAGEVRLKAYRRREPVALSDILPILENMGLRSIAENPYEVKPAGGAETESVWVHDFLLNYTGSGAIQVARIKQVFEEALLKVWKKQADDDGLNRLVISAGLGWREVMLLRTYNNFWHQARSPFSRRYVEQVLGMYPAITCALVDLFKALHDPDSQKDAERRASKINREIAAGLKSVQKLDHDRILKAFAALVNGTLRTNYFQRDAVGQPKAWISIKLDSKNIAELPLPRPMVEIFVFSARVKAIHLRGGKIARGGIRWSDRHDDFRTEILGLMKSQMVKNTVIVPLGAKGGFIVKQPPRDGGREAYQKEGVDCYKILVQALLDLTDNYVKGRVVPAKGIVRRDGDDPYLVVAADKGTATFSDIANGLSQEAGFWMDDAFASGGSTGYDHKAMAITARGAWECIKRHFRELGKDIQNEDFTVVGVGDMGGDVFGNGMLLSKHIRLQGALNHVHIFCDPNPDPATSWKERERLFKARGGWGDYDKSVLSKGGRVYERSAKSLELTPEIKAAFGISTKTVTPDELIRAILLAEAELLWFGGIGTFVKSSKQSQADADDKGNDALRVDARDIRARVIGEGANLGVTQLGRVEFARQGGKINTDFLDNSGGVDCSDHEVNIKILLSDVVASKLLTTPARNKLLARMKPSVAALVLEDNYQQSQALSVTLAKGQEQMPVFAAFIRDLEKEGRIKRSLEGLPDDETLARIMQDKGTLTRPELAVLLSYAKMGLYEDILASSIPDDPACEALLFGYFPQELHKYARQIRRHQLRREIIATIITNFLVNKMGPVFVKSRMNKHGSSVAEVVRAFMISAEIYDAPRLWREIELLDAKVPADFQTEANHEVIRLIKRSVNWFLRYGDHGRALTPEIMRLKPRVEALQKALSGVVPPSIRDTVADVERRFAACGVPAGMAQTVSLLPVMASANDIVNISFSYAHDIKSIADIYFTAGERLSLDWMRRTAAGFITDNHWQMRVAAGLIDDFLMMQADVTSGIIREFGSPAKKGRRLADVWAEKYAVELRQLDRFTGELKSAQSVDLTMLTLASQKLRQFVHKLTAV